MRHASRSRSSPVCARSTVLNRALALIERALAEHVLASADMRRLLALPGVNFVTAAALMAAVGEIGRSPTASRTRTALRWIRGC
jgi:transposase